MENVVNKYAYDLSRKGFTEIVDAMMELASKVIRRNSDLASAFITEGYQGADCVAILSNTQKSTKDAGYVLYDLFKGEAVFVNDAGEVKEVKPRYWVTMTDKHMSGWGAAKNKINKLIFECYSYNEAEIVAENAARHGSQKYINITSTKPYYSPSRYYAQTKTKEEYPSWYKAGYFQ